VNTDTALTIAAWLGFSLHVLAGVAGFRKWTPVPVIPIVNLLFALGILGYWVQRWFGYVFRGITWHAIDQLLPAYALGVGIVAGLALWGRSPLVTANGVIVAVDGVALLAAGLFLAFFRMNRLI